LPANSSKRYSAIDIGSNAVRLLVSEVSPSNGEGGKDKFKKLLFVRIPLRLGENAFTEKTIPEKKIADLLKAFSAFRNLMELFNSGDYLAYGTSALRDAANEAEVADRIKKETGIVVQVIDGKREAEIIFALHAAEETDKEKSFLCVDVGGGSTEVTLFSKGTMQASNSFPVGTIRMLQDKVSMDTWDTMKAWIKENARNGGRIKGIGTGGNINKLYRLAGKKEGKPLSFEEVKALHSELSSMTVEERIKKFSLKEDRADVIVPAARIFQSIMKWSEMSEIYVPSVGLADGMIRVLYEKNRK
jgi:exopolyphosphatase/guanosine-5'-triphosphate,3'-diphosphate pyrophosphatase